VRRETTDGEVAPTNVDALVARRLPGLKLDAMPLCRFVDLAGQLGGLPVSVDPAELQLASASAATPVSAEVKDATIEEALTAALKPLRLAPVLDQGQFVLRRPGADKRRTTVCPVDDIAANAAEVERLAGWVRRLVAPDSWEQAGGKGRLKVAGKTLEIEQREDVTYDAFIFLERYRLTRGLPTRTKYPKTLLAPGAAGVALSARLSKPTTFTFTQYTPLREVFRYWQEELEVAVLVDWPALAEQRLSPQTRIAASAIDRPWSAALDDVLAPLGLGWRPAGAKTIQITTLAKVHTEPQLELFRLSAQASATGADLAKQVEQLAAADPAAEGSPAATAVAYDDANHVLMVRAPAAVQRQLGQKLAEQSLLEPRE
jgi:hypothetical protein